MPPRLIIQIWDNDKFSLDDYLGRAYIWILFPKKLYLELVKSIKTWNQLFKSPIPWVIQGGCPELPGCLLGSVTCPSPVSGPLSSGQSECHTFLWFPSSFKGPPGGSCASSCLPVKTQILFSQKDATPLSPLPNHSSPQNWFLPPSRCSQKWLMSPNVPSHCSSPRSIHPFLWLKALVKHPYHPWPLHFLAHTSPHPTAQSCSDFLSPRPWVCLIGQLCFFPPLFKYRPLPSLGQSDLPTSVEGIASTFTFQQGMTPEPGCVCSLTTHSAWHIIRRNYYDDSYHST